MHFEQIKPVIVIQEVPSGQRAIGEFDTILEVGRGFGPIPHHVEKSTPHLLFRAISGNRYNIAYFRSALLRDVAYYRITSPNNHANERIVLGLREYFYKYSKPGTASIQAQIFNQLMAAFQTPSIGKKFMIHYSHITSKCENPADYFLTPEGRAALYMFAVDHMGIKATNRAYTLDAVIKSIHKQ